MDSELQKLGITGLTETDRQAVVVPGETLRSLPAPARLLHILRESAEAFPLTASRHETDAGDALDALLAHAGFSAAQAQELRWHRIRWPLMGDEEFEQRYGNY
ncbi:cytoplasmic protein [Salmonella enterica subsp. enterica serovar Newport]|nr:cytoplasmic protein [Salmonella enterica subsp. enterica serovar Newport]EGZ4305852.1 cytoplasmic protein [Salmonella enterica subsp. enterica serovar Hartford]